MASLLLMQFMVSLFLCKTHTTTSSKKTSFSLQRQDILNTRCYCQYTLIICFSSLFSECGKSRVDYMRLILRVLLVGSSTMVTQHYSCLALASIREILVVSVVISTVMLLMTSMNLTMLSSAM